MESFSLEFFANNSDFVSSKDIHQEDNTIFLQQFFRFPIYLDTFGKSLLKFSEIHRNSSQEASFEWMTPVFYFEIVKTLPKISTYWKLWKISKSLKFIILMKVKWKFYTLKISILCNFSGLWREIVGFYCNLFENAKVTIICKVLLLKKRIVLFVMSSRWRTKDGRRWIELLSPAKYLVENDIQNLKKNRNNKI